ncbi:MAG: protein kinase [Terracidiphilus sp.]|nr:protein kinase [Terracidiphilus sp.]
MFKLLCAPTPSPPQEFLPSCEYYTHEEALVTALARLCVLQHTNLLCCRGVCICAGDVPTHAAWEAGIVNLSEHLDMRGRMPLSEFQDMFVQVLSGLACLHSRGVAHGALTKTNIIVCQLSPRGALLFKLGDAGISRVLRGGAPASMEDDLVAIGSLACDILTQSVLCMGPSPARTSIQQQAPLACVSTLRSTAPGLADWLLTCVYGGASVTAASLLAELESLALPWEERVDVTENKSEPEARMQSLRPAPVKFASSYEVAPDSDVSSTSHGPQPQVHVCVRVCVRVRV